MLATKDLIKRYYDCFNRQDIPGFLDLLDDNVIHDLNQGGREVGKKAFADFMERMRCYKETIRDIVIMVSEDGTRAAAEFIDDGCYLETDAGLPEAKGQKYQLACGAFFAVKNNKITRVTVYYNLQDWLKQVSG
jgi:steroid delta-isomerase-like uncharacterized protein